jgi:CelD/BcsL family acetyltransferase involved in cellulose biosynthesis
MKNMPTDATMMRRPIGSRLPELADGGLEFQLVRGRDGLASIAADWTRLLGSLPGLRFFHGPGWYRAFMENVASDPDEVIFVVAYRDGRMAGVVPLRRSARKVGGLSLHVLGLIVHPHLTLADAVFDTVPKNAGLLRAAVNWLRARRDFAWDLISLASVPQRSAVTFAIQTAPPTLMLTNEAGGSCFVPCNGSYDEATRSISGSFKRNLRRLARRAEETAPLAFESHDQPQDLETALQRFLELEASGWKGKTGLGSAIACSPPLVGFYRQLMQEFGSAGQCVIKLLRHGERDVAGQFCLSVNRTFSILKIGYSEEHASFAPGNLIMARTIRDACEDPGIDAVSFVTHPPWAHVWKPQVEPVATSQVFNASLRGRLLYLLVLARRAIWKAQRVSAVRADDGHDIESEAVVRD